MSLVRGDEFPPLLKDWTLPQLLTYRMQCSNDCAQPWATWRNHAHLEAIEAEIGRRASEMEAVGNAIVNGRI